MKCISWNVNGLRACMGKGFADFFAESDADFFCLQETKLQEGQISFPRPVTKPSGTMRRKKAIPAQRFSRKTSRSPFEWEWVLMNWIRRAD